MTEPPLNEPPDAGAVNLTSATTVAARVASTVNRWQRIVVFGPTRWSSEICAWGKAVGGRLVVVVLVASSSTCNMRRPKVRYKGSTAGASKIVWLSESVTTIWKTNNQPMSTFLAIFLPPLAPPIKSPLKGFSQNSARRAS